MTTPKRSSPKRSSKLAKQEFWALAVIVVFTSLTQDVAGWMPALIAWAGMTATYILGCSFGRSGPKRLNRRGETSAAVGDSSG